MTTNPIEKLQNANRLIFVKQYTEAERILASLTETPPTRDSLIIHLRRIELASKMNKIDVLRQTYDVIEAASGSEGELKVCQVLIEQHADQLAPQSALELYQQIIKDHGPSAAAYYGLGFTLEATNQLDRAVFNYNQSVTIDPNWYPSYFGLSQIHYNLGDEKKGDQYFYQFESLAPYNVYGNFETHRKVSQEFLTQGKYLEAETAISTLSEWWFENKGQCPNEIQVYEALATSRIQTAQGDRHEAESRRNRAKTIAQQMLATADTPENVLYFVARVLEEFDEFQLAFKFYRQILKIAGNNPAIVQKIGSQFLSLGEFELANSLFDEAWQANPNNAEIRFCRLVAQLKGAKVNVEDYLIGKERLRQLSQNAGDRVEILALLHSLLAKFQNDPEVHLRLGDLYLRLGNTERASRHYNRMYELDMLSNQSIIKYATFVMQHGDPEVAMKAMGPLTKRVKTDPALSKDDLCEIGWLKATYFSRKGEIQASREQLITILNIDPWNVSYLVQEAGNLTKLAETDVKVELPTDKTLAMLAVAEENDLDWAEFDRITDKVKELHLLELAYTRSKIRFLYATNGDRSFPALVEAAKKFDASRGVWDITRLLNTNFDSVHLYLALGNLTKELWQLQAATMWFDMALKYPGIRDAQRARAYLELADCFTWEGQQLPKAVEYARLALDMGDRTDGRAMLVMSHALLRTGQVKQAQTFLEDPGRALNQGQEATFLKGLIEYRNGNKRAANAIWKPLLTVRTESMRVHQIKQEVLKYYFDNAPYLKAH